MLVTANHNVFPAAYPHPVNGSFDAPYRARQIRDQLASRPKWKPEEMLAIQKDVYSAFSHWLAREIVRAWGSRAAAKPAAAEAIEVLKTWNGQMEHGQAAPAIVAFTERKLKFAAAERAAKGKGQLYNFLPAAAVLQKLFTERPAGWFLDYDQTLVTAFVEAIDEAAKTYGSSPRRWSWGQVNRLRLGHPVLSQLPLVGAYFRLEAPLSGSPTTVRQINQFTANKLGPSMRLVADLSNWEASQANLTIGQSGHRLSSHYKDQWDAYFAGTSFPMEFQTVETKSTLAVRAK
jgi:penicillin amidase